MALEDIVKEHHKLTYSQNVQMVAQQMGNRFRAGVTEVRATGQAHRAVALFDAGEGEVAEERGRRNFDIPVPRSARWLIRPDEIGTGETLDEEDKLDAAMDPTSILMQTHMNRIQRKIDDRILGTERNSAGTFSVAYSGILGRASSGKRAETQTDLPAGNFIAHASTGLTYDKLREAQEALELADFGVDNDELFCAISPKQRTDLLNIAAATGTSLNAFTLEQLKTGKPTTLLGFTWVFTTRLPLDANGNRMCPIWSKRNIILGVWKDITGRMWNDGSARNKPVIEVAARMDCVRAEDAGVRVIECVEA